jgi:hypothetical protein
VDPSVVEADNGDVATVGDALGDALVPVKRPGTAVLRGHAEAPGAEPLDILA